MLFRYSFLVSLALMPLAAHAEGRDYCPDRPGIGTPPCIIDRGRASFEVGIGDWTVDRTDTERDDTILLGDMLLRYGVADHAEVSVEWTGLGISRRHDRVARQVDHASGTGDVTLAIRRNLRNPDGSGFSLAVMPYASLRVGRQPIGAGDWSAGMMVPLSYQITPGFSVITTAEIDAAVDEDGDGRHFALSEVVGGAFKLSDSVTTSAEYMITADDDPEGHHVEHMAGLSLGWMPGDNLQFDVGANAALDADAPDLELYVGLSRRF